MKKTVGDISFYKKPQSKTSIQQNNSIYTQNLNNNYIINKKNQNNKRKAVTLQTKKEKPRSKSLPAVLNQQKLNQTETSLVNLQASLNKKNKKAANKQTRPVRFVQYRSWSSSPENNRRFLVRKLPVVDTKNFVPYLPKIQFQMPETVNSAASKSSFIPYISTSVHQHNHRCTPHLHSLDCDRLTSGLDKNRLTRFYFTKQTTPVRCYLSYNDKLLSPSGEISLNFEKEKFSQLNPQLNGRKLSPRTLKTQLRLNPQFIEDAKNFIFFKESLSLVPAVAPSTTSTINSNTFSFLPPMTMAEMAVLPINSQSGSLVFNSNNRQQQRLLQSNNTNNVKKKLTSVSSNSITFSDPKNS